MAKRRSEVVAASLLPSWTDADTAMQIVGTSLGLFGAGPLDPTVVLSAETQLRNALFDVLLSLVEGGALEMQVAGDNRYAFRWRDDVAIAGLAAGDSTPIDLAVPSPHLAELERIRAERDNALGRAEFAEALAAERERLLRLAEARRAPSEPAVETPASKPALRKPAARKATPKNAEPEKAPKPARRKPAPKPAEPLERVVAAATPEVVVLSAAEAATTPAIDVVLEAYGTVDGGDEAGELEERPARRPKWSGYSLDRSRAHLTSVDRLVEDA
ncbi:MAG TPA: hypothetical protein VL769_05155 [Acidimicrobiia bacterium]|nr:hypothetical protein [Acidimicrobiia bacterium]